MATSKVISLKLMIDTNSHKVLFAEAGKDFVDFLFNILSLPLGSVIRLLTKKDMVGCLANLYESVRNLDQTYIQPNQNKDTLLKPTISTVISQVPLLSLNHDTTTTASASTKNFYRCGRTTCTACNSCVTEDSRSVCPVCKNPMATVMTYIPPPAGDGKKVAVEGDGFVKGVVTYMVMDDLVVTPMSTISSITLLNQFHVKEVAVLKEKMVEVGMEEGLMLLKASLKGCTVLTRVFLGKAGA